MGDVTRPINGGAAASGADLSYCRGCGVRVCEGQRSWRRYSRFLNQLTPKSRLVWSMRSWESAHPQRVRGWARIPRIAWTREAP